MEKLIELLNESAVLDTIFENEYQVKFRATKIISKELGFIKWLVDNNKIDLDKVEQIERDWFVFNCSHEEAIIMYVSISDNPIQDLISLLK